MRAKYLVVGLIGALVGVLLSSAVVVLAGNLDPPYGPADAASQMVTLEQIYNRLNDGTAASKMTSFTEPLAGPGSTMHTLDEIYDLVGAPAPVPKTGATESPLAKGVVWPNPRFTIHDSDTPGYTNDDTVTDNLTGLMWTRNTTHPQKQWYDGGVFYPAHIYCNTLTLGGYDDWRLPNVRELESLVHYGFWDPAVPNTEGTDQWSEEHPFIGVQSDYYWSSTTKVGSPGYAWVVGLRNGDVGNSAKADTRYVWPVRGGQ